ncbi:Cytochrome P450 [Frankia canadensis]|uniref:Cytochrome P450 n=1 Tax=Frankia canadensis TaxID=1836972 RepID=A0A2I2KTL1_9ACTN|nr:cytochrome P450 [Frankia canadensis]SNQ48990.1 Cytochrome P450 [Frankia canadensis]SOU56280.1 Cytochrome P450 [Frankia canadensis]
MSSATDTSHSPHAHHPPAAAPASAARDAEEVPGPTDGPVASLRRLRADPLNRFGELAREHGPVVRIARWPVSAFLVTEPEAIADALVSGHRAYAKGAVRRRGRAGSRETVVQPLALLLGQGLLTSAGDVHRRQRRLMQPLFHKQRIAGYADAFASIAADTAAGWDDGQLLDLHAEMTRMTLAIIARTLFDVDLDSRVVDVVRTALDETMPAARRAPMPGFSTVERLPLPGARRRRASRDALDQVVLDLIAQRRAAGATGADLLSLLLSARDADTGAPMDDAQVRDEALTLLLAGHETTANALSWTFHLLGDAAEVRAVLQAELDEVLGDRLPTIDDLPRLPYTGAVFQESMRLFPPVWAMGRHLVEDRDVAGYRLPAGSTLVFSQWVVHRDARWWSEPDRFDPTRWLQPPDTEADAARSTPPRPRFAYFPFGAGPRQCIGNTLAVTEGIMALATLARHWTFAPVPGRVVTPQPLVTLRPRNGLPMTARRRP